MSRTLIALLTALVLLTSTNDAKAQDVDAPRAGDATPDGESWYESSTQQPTPRMIIQQKAQVRAYQRMARIESMKWYGMSASRPLASTTPFMGIPSPRWQMPGGRPFAWTPYRGTSVYIVR